MSKPIKQTSQAGFTLVELAIVMIIIGLLIAGVLKGQELIGNARVTATVAQIKGIDAATSTFKDTYATLPGDFAVAPSTRLPNCAALPCNFTGNGDGKLATTPAAAPTGESTAFFPQLASADLLTGISPNAVGGTAFGVNFPAAKIDGSGFFAGSSTNPAADLTTVVGTLGTGSGLYLSLVNTVAGVTAASEGLTPSQASRIDTKLDDGQPGVGSVVAIGGATCGIAGAGGNYVTSSTSNLCGLYIRIQG
jgi:prepilin-type N-terminal cleavage/methylation domain-containing protein